MATKITRGSVFHRIYRSKSGELKRTATLYVKFYANGKPVTLPAGTEDEGEALTYLRKKMADAAIGGPLAEMPERVKMGQLFDLMLAWYRLNERRTLYDLERLIESRNGLRVHFGNLKAQALGSSAQARYVAARRREDPAPANATINRALAYVRRAMKLGAQQDPPLVLRVPHFEMLPVAEPRQGVVSHEEYRVVRDLLPRYARIALVIGYHTGLRKGMILQIRRDLIDLKKLRIELPGRRASNKGAPRFLPIYGDMAAELDLALSAITEECRKLKTPRPDCPLLVQRNGKPVQDFERSGQPPARRPKFRRRCFTICAGPRSPT
jgi:TPR repeat protein